MFHQSSFYLIHRFNISFRLEYKDGEKEEEFDVVAPVTKKKAKQQENEELLVEFNENYGLVPPPYPTFLFFFYHMSF